MRIWVKLIKENHLIKDMVVENNNYDISRTKRVLSSLEEACHEFDLAVPVWLDSTIKDFQRTSKTRFKADSFTEAIGFDYMEFHVIEE